jgi:glycosyltransferase involved in cell wall biosynthesis
MKQTILITAPIFSVSGYGKKAKDIIKSIIKQYENIYDIKIIVNNWGTNPNHLDEFFTKFIINNVNFQPHIYIHIGLPNEMKRIGTLYNILFTSSIETNIMDISWINGANLADLVIVPSQFAKASFIDTIYENNDTKELIKFKQKCEILFEGVNVDLFKSMKSSEIVDIDLSQIREKFCFLFVGQWVGGTFGNDRKNIGNLIKNFCETFKSKVDKPALIIKTNMGNSSKIDYYKCLDELQEIKNKYCPKNSPNIYLLHGEFTDTQMVQLYNHTKLKAFVSLTRGEGFNRIPAEFACATNKPIILANYSGHLDYIDENHSLLIGGTLIDVHPSALVPNVIIQGSKWFDPNYDDSTKLMKYVFENYNKTIDIGQRQGRKIRDEFSLQKMDEKLKQIFDEYVPRIAEIKLPEFLK